LTWDNAGSLTRIQDGSIIDIRYTLDSAGQVTQANMTVPLDPATVLTSETKSYTYGGASQLSSAGYTYDSRGRLTAAAGHSYTWDGATRLIGIDSANLTYNGLGRLISRTESGGTVRCHYNNAIGLTPIVAEQDENSGQFLCYYIWTPGGSLLYMIDASDNNEVCFFHFDRTGSTLALTDTSGTVTDSYAFAPYGKLLQHNGGKEQPFTFVGKWGVRHHSSGGDCYHMRTRYYDPVTASFLSREPLWPRIWDPKQVNPYQYALANPISYVDSTGAIPKGAAKKLLKGEGKGIAKEAGGSLIEEVLDLPSVPITPTGAVMRFFEGTPTGYSEGDPEWGYGNPQVGYMNKEQFENYQWKMEQERVQAYVEQLQREMDAYYQSDEYKEWKKRDEMRAQRDADLLVQAAIRAQKLLGKRQAPYKGGVWVRRVEGGEDRWLFFENATLLGQVKGHKRIVLDVNDELGVMWLDDVLEVRNAPPVR
jgi:RHS repeat-associated protein